MSFNTENMAEIGQILADLGGLLFILAVIFLMSLAAGLVARKVKGRRFTTWFGISALTQLVAIVLPTSFLILLGIIDPANWFGATKAVTFESFRLLAEMSVVAGSATLLVIAFLEQTRWKTCHACQNQVPWAAQYCPHCASSQTITPRSKKKMAPGTYPRLASRTIHLPVELDRRLSQLTASMRKERRLSDEAAVSQFIRDILIRADAAAEEQDEKQADQP